jgi:LacI family transcriptional regulator
VARLAGTSSSTVSRVLNGRPGVAPATRQRVLDAIETLQFVPDPTARALSRAALGAPVVALALARSVDGSPYYGLLRRALVQAAEQFNLRALEVDEQEMETTQADAVICVRDELSERALDILEARGRAVVVIGQHARTSWVCVDDVTGMAEVTRLLIRAGHQDIVHLGSETPLVMPRARLQGYRRAMKETGLPGALLSLPEGGFMVGAYRAVTWSWSKGQRFTALA